MIDRIPLDNMNSDQLDALYSRVEQAEAAVARVRDLADRYQRWHEGGWRPASAAAVAREYRALLGEQRGPAATEATDPEQGGTMPTTPCNATITGVNVPDGETLTCTVEDIGRHPANHIGPTREYGHVLWTDRHAGATPHQEQP